MTLARVRGGDNPSAAKNYRQMLEQQAKRFGVAPERIRGMESPTLVREVVGDHDPQKAITDFNKIGTAELTPAERAISDSKRLSQRTVDYLASRIDEQGPTGTMAQALEGTGGREIVSRLVEDGVITQQETNKLLNKDNTMTPEGKLRIARLMSGRFFEDAKDLESAQPELRAKLDRIVAPLARVAGREGWDLAPAVKEAVGLVREAQKRGQPVDDVVSQQGLFGATSYSEDAIAIARKMEGKPTELTRAFRQYAGDEALSRSDAPMTLGFEPPTREDAFHSAFGERGAQTHFAELPEGAELGEHGPVLRQFRGNAAGAIQALQALGSGEAIAALNHPAVGDIDLVWGGRGYGLAKIVQRHPEVLSDLQGIISGLDEQSRNPNTIQLSDGRYDAVLRRNWKGQPKTWLLTAFEKREGPSAARTIDVRGAHATKRQAPPPGGSSSNIPPQGLLPQLKPSTVAAGLARARASLLSIFAPSARSNASREASYTIREHNANLARRDEVVQKALASTRAFFSRRQFGENVDFMDRMERGVAQPVAEMTAMANQMRSLLDAARDEIQALGTGKLEGYYTNYFPHIWKDPEKAAGWLRALVGKKPLEGPKSFLKQRSIATIKDGLSAGLEPVSENPADLVMLKLHEMHRYLLMHQMMDQLNSEGHTTYVPATQRAADGLSRIDDNIATVWGKPTVTVHEAFDAPLMQGLEAFARSIGVSHERLVRLKGKGIPTAAQGWANTAGEVKTKFGSPEQVLAHEIGHQVEFKYGISKALKGPGIAKELNDLAALRWEGQTPSARYKAYARTTDEKMANAIAALIYAPERFRETAPRLWDALRDELHANPETRSLLNVRKSMTLGVNEAEIPVGGMVVRGHYWAPTEVATLINNHLTPGLRGNMFFDAYMTLGNGLNQLQLGLSAYHFGTTAMEAIVSHGALAVRQAAARQGKASVKSAAQAFVAPVTYYLQGDKVLKAMRKPGSQGADLEMMANAVVKAGGRASMDRFYDSGGQARKMADAFRRGGLGGVAEGVARIPMALPDLTSYAVMKEFVPRLKLAAFANLAQFELEQYQRRQGITGPPTEASVHAVRGALSRAWDSVDNRFGQLVYDNLFWHKAVKDLSMASVRAVGWNLGGLRETGGGIADALLRNSEGERLTNRSAYLISGAVYTGVLGGAMYFLLTGKQPEQWQDYYFPGGHAMPGFVKDDVNWGTHPWDTAKGKVHPLAQMLWEMSENRNHYGRPLTDAEWYEARSWLDKLKAEGKEQLLPITIRQVIENGPQEFDWAQFFGMPREPRAIRDSR